MALQLAKELLQVAFAFPVSILQDSPAETHNRVKGMTVAAGSITVKPHVLMPSLDVNASLLQILQDSIVGLRSLVS